MRHGCFTLMEYTEHVSRLCNTTVETYWCSVYFIYKYHVHDMSFPSLVNIGKSTKVKIDAYEF